VILQFSRSTIELRLMKVVGVELSQSLIINLT